MEKNHQRFSIFDLVPISICVIRSDFSVIFWNKTMEEWTGMPAKEMLGKNITMTCPGLDRPICINRLNSLFDDGIPVIFSSRLHKDIFPVKLPNGEPRIHKTTVSAITIEPDKRFGALFSVEDVTGLSRTMNDLLESRNFLKEIFNSIQDGISVTDLNHTIRFVNPVVEQKYAGGGPVTGRKSHECYFGASEPLKNSPSLRCIESRETESAILPAPPGCDAKWIELFAYPIKSPESGQVTGVIEYIRDVTVRRQIEEELFRAKMAAEVATRAKSEFLANMSHEIRTPLNAVIGAAEILSGTSMTKEQRQIVDMLSVNSEYLLNIVNDIIDISKIEAGKIDLENIEFNLKNLVEKVCNIFEVNARKKGLTLNRRIDPDLPLAVKGDPSRIRQVLINLVSNAVKFTTQGHISVSCGYEKDNKDNILFSVSDTGIGISGFKQEIIFKSFTQADTSTTRQFGGTGLGLAICRRLVELMGGRISVTSQLNKGSTFYFTTRFEHVQASKTASAPPSCKEGENQAAPNVTFKFTKPARILLVEDYKYTRLIVLHFLMDTPFELDMAENGAQAVEKFTDKKYDLILMDLQMPVMDGYSATREIRKIEKSKGLPSTRIIALSAFALSEDRQKSIDAGCNDHLNKPVTKEALFEMLAQYLPAEKVISRPAGI
ncbi:MAG: response regulator [Deltaproteobacteria bacterium]|nr:response regulator [Deltaproteobacteria bacterium]